MAVRNESVRLSLQDDFTSGMARAAAATALFKKELDGLDGKSVSRDLDNSSKSVDRFGNSTRTAERDIDKFSGRMGLLADAAITLGPALIPLGASTIPVLTSAIAGLGAAAGGLGVTLLAVSGLGKGLKAIDAYQLEPTVENLQKMRIEMDKLGPAGAEFAHFIDGLEPQLSNLQNIARSGLFPGVEDGIKALMKGLPGVKDVVAQLAFGMGDLAREAGDALAGPKFSAFFHYIETDARPTLDAFAHSFGSVTEGVANLLVAFAPLTRDFTSGLESATAAFAKWSEGLGQNQGFQNFLQYIRESGPQVAHFMGALSEAIVGVIRAAAPMGQVVLPALTALAQVFAAVANSPIGPVLYTAAAGLIAFNRAAAVFNSEKLASGFASITANATTMGGKLAAVGSAGAAAALALGTVSDSMQILDSRSRSNSTLDATVQSLQDLQDTVQFSNLGKYANDLHIDLGRLTDDLAKNGAQGEYVQQVQKQLASSSHGVGAAFNALAGNIIPFYTASADKAYDANKDLNTILGDVGDGLNTNKGAFAGLIGSLQAGTSAALDLSGALAQLNGWFDKRDAVRGYKDSIDALRKSLKNGFTREDAANLDSVGRSIVQVAQQIKNPQLQANFLANARAELQKTADGSGKKAAAAIQEVIDKMDKVGLTHPKAKVEADTSDANAKVDDAMVRLHKYGNTVAIAKVSADTGQAQSAIGGIETMLRNLNGTTATTYVRTVRQDIPLPGKSADGGTVPKTGMPYADRHHYLLADGEEVISNRHGQADRHRSLLKAINANRLADGGTTGGNHHTPVPNAAQGGPGFQVFTLGVYSAAKAIKAFKHELDAAQKSLDNEKKARDNIVSAMDSLKSDVASGLRSDIFAQSSPYAASGGVASTLSALQSDIGRGNQFSQLVAQLKKRGVHGQALQALLQTHDVATLQQFAGASNAQLAQYQAEYDQRDAVLSSVGQASANAVYGQALRAANNHVDAVRDEVRGLRRDIKRLEESNKKAHDKNAKDVGAAVNGAASNGHRRGQRGPRS